MKVYFLTIWDYEFNEDTYQFSVEANTLKEAQKKLLDAIYEKIPEYFNDDPDDKSSWLETNPLKSLKELSHYDFCHRLYCHNLKTHKGREVSKNIW